MATGLLKAHTGIFEALTSGLQDYVNIYSTTRTATTAVGNPLPGFFHSSVLNRPAIPDISNDLGVSMGVSRIPMQQLYSIPDEFGLNGEPVWGLTGDDLGLVRFVGSGWANNIPSGAGISQAPQSSTDVNNDYVEITFYGTGLNILTVTSNFSTIWRYSVDGGTESNNFWLSSSNTLSNLNTYQNAVLKVVSGLSLGVHTVKIRKEVGYLYLSGYEVVNESSSICVNPGVAYIQGSKTNLAVRSSFAYSADVSSTRGGRMLVYLKSDATIGYSFQPVDTTAKYLTDADHSSEELIRSYHWREFGVGKNNDFNGFVNSTGASLATAYTLDDSTTSLSVKAGSWTKTLQSDGLCMAMENDQLIFNFVGTGLDIEITGDQQRAQHLLLIDGSYITLSNNRIYNSANKQKYKIVSGLPYGSHTCKIIMNGSPISGTVTLNPNSSNVTGVSTTFLADLTAGDAIRINNVNYTVLVVGSNTSLTLTLPYNGTNSISNLTVFKNAPFRIHRFFVYGPKKPSLPAASIELADYCLLGNFPAYPTNLFGSIDYIPSGTIRKLGYRDWFLGTNGWNSLLSYSDGLASGQAINTTTTGTWAEYTFFGTGISIRQLVFAGSVSYTYSLNGSTNFSNITSTVYGAGSFVPSTGVLSFNSLDQIPNPGITFRNLPLGLHKLRITYTSGTGAAAGLYIDNVDIITPIHNHVENRLYSIFNVQSVGSCTISDNRNTSILKELSDKKKTWVFNPAQVQTDFTIPTADGNVVTSGVSVPGLFATIKTSGGRVKITYSGAVKHSVAGQNIQTWLRIDGVQFGPRSITVIPTANAIAMTGNTWIGTLSPGVHRIDVMAAPSSATATPSIVMANQTLIVEEI